MALNIGELFATLSLDMTAFKQGLNQAEASMSSAGASMMKVGAGLTAGLTAPIVAFGAAAMKTGTEFNDSMSKIQAITGATGGDLKKLRDMAIDLGSTTMFSAKDAADGMTFLGQAGWDTTQIMAGMPGVLNLAAAGQLSLAQSSDILVSVMGGFGMAAEEAGRGADVLAYAAAATNTDVYLMGESMKYAAPIAKQMGLSIEEASAMIGLMSNAGIKGSEAGTALRAGLIRLASPAEKTSKLMGELGMEFSDAEGNIKPMGDILKILREDLYGMDEATRIATASQIFGMEAASGWLAVLDMGPEAFDALVVSLNDSAGAAEEMAKIMEDNIGGSIRNMESAFEGVQIAIFDILEPAMRKAVDFIAELFGAFTSLPTSTQTAIVVFAAVAAAIGPVLLAVGAVTAAIGAIGVPVAAAVAAIGLLVAGLTSAYASSESFRDVVNASLTKVKEVFDVVFGFVKQIVQDVMKDAAEFFGEKIKYIKKFWDENGKMIQQAFENVFNAIKKVVEFVMPFIADFIMEIWGNIKMVFSGALDIILGLVKTFAALFTGNWSEMWEGVKQILGGIMEALWGLINLWLIGKAFKLLKGFWDETLLLFKNMGGAVKNFVSKLWDEIVTLFNNGGTKAGQFVRGMWDSITGFFSKAISPLTNFVSNLWSSVTNFFTKGTSDSVNFVSKMWTNVLNAFKNALSPITNAVSSIWTGITNIFSKMATDAIKWGKNMISGFIDGIKSMGTKAADAAKGVMNSVGDFLKFWSPSKKGPGRFIVHWGRNMIDGFLDGVRDMDVDVGSTVSSLMDTVNKQIQTPVLLDSLQVAGSMAANGVDNQSPASNNYKLETTIHNGTQQSPTSLRRQQQRLLDSLAYEWGE